MAILILFSKIWAGKFVAPNAKAHFSRKWPKLKFKFFQSSNIFHNKICRWFEPHNWYFLLVLLFTSTTFYYILTRCCLRGRLTQISKWLTWNIRLHIIDPRKLVIQKPALEKFSCLQLKYHKLWILCTERFFWCSGTVFDFERNIGPWKKWVSRYVKY